MNNKEGRTTITTSNPSTHNSPEMKKIAFRVILFWMLHWKEKNSVPKELAKAK